MGKAIQTLNMHPPAKEQDTEEQQTQKQSKFLLPPVKSRDQTVLMPVSFKQILKAEWKKPSRPRKAPRTISKLYAMPEESMSLLKVPLVDQPLTALALSAIIPQTAVEDQRMHVISERVDAVLRKGFE